MQRIQKSHLLMTLAFAALVGCSKPLPEPSPAQYLHDIDSLNARNAAERDRRKNRPNDPPLPGDKAASDVYMAFNVSKVGRCWPKKEVQTTANTDHECLEKLGYKRP